MTVICFRQKRQAQRTRWGGKVEVMTQFDAFQHHLPCHWASKVPSAERARCRWGSSNFTCRRDRGKGVPRNSQRGRKHPAMPIGKTRFSHNGCSQAYMSWECNVQLKLAPVRGREKNSNCNVRQTAREKGTSCSGFNPPNTQQKNTTEKKKKENEGSPLAQALSD